MVATVRSQPAPTRRPTSTPRDAQRSPSSAPDPSKHTAVAGDTLYGIARQREIDPKDILAANPQISDPNKIRIGQEINLPAGQASTDAPETAAEAEAPASDTTADASTVRETRTRARTASVTARARIEANLTAPASAETTGAPAAAGAAAGATAAAPEAAAATNTGGIAPAPLFSSGTLRRGQDGAAVTNLQQQLNARGAQLEIDSDFGPSTQRAVQSFQRAQGLEDDGIVGPKTRQAFRDTATADAAPVDGSGQAARTDTLRQGAEGPAVEALQERLNAVAGESLQVDGDFGRRTSDAVERFQLRAGIDNDGVAGPDTMRALSEVEAGTRTLAAAPVAAAVGPVRPNGPTSQSVTVGDNTFNVHNMVRRDFGRNSVPGNRIISMDANSVSGRPGEILRPLVVIPNNATPQERAAAQQAVDRVAEWMDDNLPGTRRSTGVVRTTAQNGRGIGGFYHTEFHSVNDTDAVNLIRERPQEYARILGETLGQIPGANFIVPHGNVNGSGRTDPGAVSADGRTSEIELGRFIIEEGFKNLND